MKSGTNIVQVSNTDLAVCLASVGVKLREDPPYTHLVRGEETYWVFNFEATDVSGTLDTKKMCEAFSQDAKWMTDHPQHPFTFAMVALKNFRTFRDFMETSKPYVSFKAPNGASVLHVVQDSKKHARCIEKGMVQI
tara:strand:+ start:17946 stop:18353 length:408 start_codon:yes stop_codon:yes gene_type:complete